MPFPPKLAFYPLIEGFVSESALLAELHALCFEPPWSEKSFRELFENSSARVIGIKHGGLWQCFAMTTPCVDDVELVSIATRPDQQGKGLARMVLTRVLEVQKASGTQHVLLEVAEDNLPARKLYEALGFELDGRRPRYYPRPDGSAADALLMSASLF